MKVLAAMLSFLVGAGIAGIGWLWSARSDPDEGERRLTASMSSQAPAIQGSREHGSGLYPQDDGLTLERRDLPSVRADTTGESDVIAAGPPSAALATEMAARMTTTELGAGRQRRGGALSAVEIRADSAARARTLDAEIASGPPSPELMAQAQKIRASVRALSLPGQEALKEAACGPTACRFQVPPAMAGPVRAWLASVPDDGALLVHRPEAGDGGLAVYIQATAMVPAISGGQAMPPGGSGRPGAGAIDALPEPARLALAAGASARGAAR